MEQAPIAQNSQTRQPTASQRILFKVTVVRLYSKGKEVCYYALLVTMPSI